MIDVNANSGHTVNFRCVEDRLQYLEYSYDGLRVDCEHSLTVMKAVDCNIPALQRCDGRKAPKT
jgi:hypothetical protein